MHIHVYIYLYVHIYIYTCIYIYMYMYVHIRVQKMCLRSLCILVFKLSLFAVLLRLRADICACVFTVCVKA